MQNWLRKIDPKLKLELIPLQKVDCIVEIKTWFFKVVDDDFYFENIPDEINFFNTAIEIIFVLDLSSRIKGGEQFLVEG